MKSRLQGKGVHPAITALSLSSAFISAVTTYISHLDPSVRRCGMLVAEEVARTCGKTLDFGDWDGDKDGKRWSREMRALMQERDSEASDELVYRNPTEADARSGSQINVEVDRMAEVEHSPSDKNGKSKIETVPLDYDSDDSLTGYLSEPSSSRSASPTPSELDEIEKDPTLRVGKVTINRPVYLAQLSEMIRPLGGVRSEEDQEEPKRIEVALDAAEELIRRKRAYGTELGECCAVSCEAGS
jgi:telomere length regulation protein